MRKSSSADFCCPAPSFETAPQILSDSQAGWTCEWRLCQTHDEHLQQRRQTSRVVFNFSQCNVISVLTKTFEEGCEPPGCLRTAEVIACCNGGPGLWRHRHHHHLLLFLTDLKKKHNRAKANTRTAKNVSSTKAKTQFPDNGWHSRSTLPCSFAALWRAPRGSAALLGRSQQRWCSHCTPNSHWG